VIWLALYIAVGGMLMDPSPRTVTLTAAALKQLLAAGRTVRAAWPPEERARVAALDLALQEAEAALGETPWTGERSD
jgi:hypothetical protein